MRQPQGLLWKIRKEETKCQEEMEQDLEVRGQEQVAAAELEWVADKAEWAVKDWVPGEIVSALLAGQKHLIREESPVFR